MKKSVLSIVAIAFAAVSVLSSCNKNDDGYGQSAKTTTVTTNQTNVLPGQTSQVQNDQYRIIFKYVGTENSKKVSADIQNEKFSGTEDNAFNSFKTMYASRMSDLQKFLDARAKEKNATDAKVICTLTDSKGNELQHYELEPGN